MCKSPSDQLVTIITVEPAVHRSNYDSYCTKCEKICIQSDRPISCTQNLTALCSSLACGDHRSFDAQLQQEIHKQ